MSTAAAWIGGFLIVGLGVLFLVSSGRLVLWAWRNPPNPTATLPGEPDFELVSQEDEE